MTVRCFKDQCRSRTDCEVSGYCRDVFSPPHDSVVLSLPTIIMPDNEHGIEPGNYKHRDLVALLRQFKTNPEAIQFIADMLE